MAENSEPIWLRLSQDPRDPQYANLRASDADRTVISQAVGDAFADGRLDRAEYDERADAVLRAKTLGDFLPLLEDLMPPAATGTALIPAAGGDLQVKAEQAYGRELRGTLTGFFSASAITSGIWVATAVAGGAPYFFWPIFPILGTGIGVVSTLINKQDRIQAKYDRMLEERNRQAVGGDQGDALPPGGPTPGPNRLTGRYPAGRDWRQDRRDWRQARRNWR